LGLSLGALVLSFAQHLAGGPWGSLVARPLESAMTLIPLMALLFVPVLLGMNQLYPWTDAAYVAEHPTVAAKTEYLNVPWFVIRAVVYFAVWTGAALLYRRTSLRQDEDAPNAGTIGYRLRSASGLWFVFYVLTMTFAGIDWAMSLTPVWFSGIYPVIIMASQAITAIAFAILAITWLAARNPSIDALLTPRRLQDLGNFLLAFTMFWAYTQVSQLIIQWSNNVVETASWYVVRLGPGWVGVSAFLLFFGFFAPFFVLFSRWVKRKRRALSIVAVWALFTQAVNYFWFIAPTFGREGFALTLTDVLVFVGIGGIWLAAFARQLASRQVLPANDPRLVAAAMEHHG
ncbi:MAG TPA: hypothetical protein VKY42_01675, partial [Trueperaceae bacterium]|nr:hypothetical protein [Trueperaceae bacterium]